MKVISAEKTSAKPSFLNILYFCGKFVLKA
jgi:hypothetical protein